MKKLPLLLLMLNNFTVLLGVGIIIPVLPAYLTYFQASGTTAGLLVAAFGFSQFLFSPLGGKWSDRYGRKPLILFGLVLNALSHYLFAVADQLTLLYLSRLIGGIGLGLSIPPMMAYVADVTEPEHRGKGMGWIGASVGLGIALGPGIGGFLAEISIRAPYYAATILTIVAVTVSAFFLPETRSRQARLAHIRKPAATTRTSLLQQLLLTYRSKFIMLLVLNFVMTFGLMNYETVFPLLANDRYTFTTKEIAMIVTAGAMMGVAAQTFLLTRLLKRYGEYRLIHVSLCLSAAAMFMLLVWGNFMYILVVSTLFFMLQALLRTSITTLLSKRATEEEQGYAAGLGNTSMSLGNILGPVAAGMLYEVQQSLPYVLGAFVLLIGMGLFLTYEQREEPNVPSKTHSL